jgi:hypothetical protein
MTRIPGYVHPRRDPALLDLVTAGIREGLLTAASALPRAQDVPEPLPTDSSAWRHVDLGKLVDHVTDQVMQLVGHHIAAMASRDTTEALHAHTEGTGEHILVPAAPLATFMGWAGGLLMPVPVQEALRDMRAILHVAADTAAAQPATAPAQPTAATFTGRARAAGAGPCSCECQNGGFCGGCGHAGCGSR